MDKLFDIKTNENQKRECRNDKVIFKEYNMDKMMLPANFGQLIPNNHIVRKVNSVIENIDFSNIYSKYSGGGASSYHPKMLLKVILYAYLKNIYSGREMAKLLKENIHFMWLAAGNYPDFRTINTFRSKILKDEIDQIFVQVLLQMIDEGYIKASNYFLDGTKIEANARKYSFVWSKSTRNYSEKLQVKIINLLAEIEDVIQEEEKLIKTKSLKKKEQNLNSDDLKVVLEEVENELSNDPKNKVLKNAKKTLEKDYIPRSKKYETYREITGERNSFSKTDNDATFMRMKEDHMKNGQLKAGYNIQIGTENQFILNYSIHQKPSDSTCLIPHMENFIEKIGIIPENLVADAGYGSEENYDFIDILGSNAFVKYNMFHKEDSKKYREDIFRSANFPYDEGKNEFTCPIGRKLKFRNISIKKSSSGYESEIHYFECVDCSNCNLKEQCTKAEGNRVIQVNFKLKERRKKAKELLRTAKGRELRKQRCIDVEPVFGMIKHNHQFRRFNLRSLEKVNIEWGLLSIAHNIRKLHKLINELEKDGENTSNLRIFLKIWLKLLKKLITKKKEVELEFYF